MVRCFKEQVEALEFGEFDAFGFFKPYQVDEQYAKVRIGCVLTVLPIGHALTVCRLCVELTVDRTPVVH